MRFSTPRLRQTGAVVVAAALLATSTLPAADEPLEHEAEDAQGAVRQLEQPAGSIERTQQLAQVRTAAGH